MNILEAINARHSVRSYKTTPIPADMIAELKKEIDRCNAEGDLHIQLVTNEDKAFDGFMAHYGKFSGVRNYIALIGKKSKTLDERIGYYGEQLVLKAQMLGLNSCWVALTMKKGVVKSNCAIGKGEKLVCVLPIGYGTTQGVAHKSKDISELCQVDVMPEWFKNGMKTVQLAPTAINQQKFIFTLNGKKVCAKPKGGFYTKVDLGIVKYHFEIGAGKENFVWE